jgi:hypothetical protein
VRLLSDPDLLVPLVLAVFALVVTGALWRLRWQHRRRIARRRAAAYQLIDCLKAYTAWIDWHRDEPLLHQNPTRAASPRRWRRRCRSRTSTFPNSAPSCLDLLRTHRELMQYLWEENILRMKHASPLRPHYADPRYHNIRDRQDCLLDRPVPALPATRGRFGLRVAAHAQRFQLLQRDGDVLAPASG